MSTIEAGRITLVEHPFDVGATLDEVAQMFAASSCLQRYGAEHRDHSRLPQSSWEMAAR
jgi:hypothetical protein